MRPKKDNNISFFYQQLFIAIILSVLFGLGWGIGLLATQDIHTNKTVRDMFAALFVIITAFHGLFIFIMQCLRSIDVRNSWKKCFFGMTGKHVSEFSSSTLPRKHQQQIQAKEKSGRTNKLADITKESSIFGHKDLTSEKHSIDKDKEIENQFEEEKIDPPIVIAMTNINTEEEINVNEVLAETSLTKEMSLTKESSIFGHKDLTSEKHSIDKDKEIENQFEEEKIDPPIVIAMANINTEEEINVNEVLAETSLTKEMSLTKESSIFGHKDLTSEKHSIDKDKEIENQFEEEKIDPPIVIAMANINTEEEINVNEVLAETSLAKSLSDEAKRSQHDEETVATNTD